MQHGDLIFVPQLLRRVLVVSLLLLSILGLVAVYHFIFVQREIDLAVAAMGASQASLTGLAFIALVSYSLRMKSPDDIQKLVDTFFLDNLCPAFQRIETAPRLLREFDPKSRQALKRTSRSVGKARVFTDYVPGEVAGSFLIETTTGDSLDMYVKVNVRHVTVKYFIDPALFDSGSDEAEFRTAFGQTLVGARSVGFEPSVFRRFHASKGRDVLELSLSCDFGFELVVDPARQLFLRNDLQTLSSSVLHTLRACG